MDAQAYYPKARLTTIGRNDHVIANDPRPLSQALLALSERYGWAVDYEDPVYSLSESKDITSPDWRRTHPGEPGILVAAGGSFDADLGRADAIRSHEDDVLRSMVRQYNQTGNPGVFKLIEASGGRTAIAGRSRSAEQSDSYVMEATIPTQQSSQDGLSALTVIVSKCSEASQTHIVLGLIPVNLLNQTIVKGTAEKATCRAEVAKVLSGLPGVYSYQMLYDISGRQYFLSIVPVLQARSASDGR